MAQLTEKEMAHKVILAAEQAQQVAMGDLFKGYRIHCRPGAMNAREALLGEWNQTLAWAKQKLGVK